MRALIIKTYRYGDLKSDPRFSLEIAFRRLNGVLETVSKTLPGGEILIAVPAEELKEASHSVKIGRNQRLTTLDALENESEWFNSTRQMLVFDEQGFYASPELISKVVDNAGDKPATWFDTDMMLWSFNFHESCKFFVAPASHVKKNLHVLENGGFLGLMNAVLADEGRKINLAPADVATMYKRAVLFNPYPYHFYVEPTSRCNSNCLMCPFHGTKPGISDGRVYLGDGGDNMPLATFKRVVDQIASIGWNYLPHYRTTMITAQARGEPTMAPDCKEMFAYVKEKGVRLSFTTNGSLLHKNGLAEYLVDIGTDEIIVSIDGDEEEYAKIRPKLDYRQVVANLQLLRRLRDEKGKGLPMLYTKRVRMEDSSDDANRRYLEKFTHIADWCGVAYENYDDYKTEGKGYADYFFDVDSGKRLPCIWAIDVGMIKADGRVEMCIGAPEHYIGDVNEKPLSEILLEHPLRKSILENHSTSYFDEPVFCYHCTSWKHNYHKFFEENGFEVKMNPVLTYWRKKPFSPASDAKVMRDGLFRRIKKRFGFGW